jgi:hypothetical protein
MSGWNVRWRELEGLFDIQLFIPCVIDNMTIRGNISHRILALFGKFSAYYQCWDQRH